MYDVFSNNMSPYHTFPIILTHLCQMDSSTLTLWTGPFPTEGVSGQFLLLPCFMKIPVFNANSVDSDDAFCM